MERTESKKFPLIYQDKTFYVPDDIVKGIKRDEDEKDLHLENFHVKIGYYPMFIQRFVLHIFDIFN